MDCICRSRGRRPNPPRCRTKVSWPIAVDKQGITRHLRYRPPAYSNLKNGQRCAMNISVVVLLKIRTFLGQ
jgi:hypothetical protein